MDTNYSTMQSSGGIEHITISKTHSYDKPELKESTKRRRTEKERADSGDSGHGSSTSPQLEAIKEFTVDRPSRASSSSPLEFINHREDRFTTFDIIRNRPARASLGHDRNPRFRSPSDNAQPSNFYRQALRKDSHMSRSHFLSGHWMANGSKRSVTTSKSDPPRTSDYLGHQKHITIKRKMESMDTT